MFSVFVCLCVLLVYDSVWLCVCVSLPLSLAVSVCFSVCLFVSFKWREFVYHAFQKAQRTGANDTLLWRGCFCVSVWVDFFGCLAVCVCVQLSHQRPINDGHFLSLISSCFITHRCFDESWSLTNHKQHYSVLNRSIMWETKSSTSDCI